MKRVVIAFLWAILFGIFTYACILIIILCLSLGHHDDHSWSDAELLDAGRMASFLAFAVPTIGLLLGFYGKLPGTKPDGMKASVIEEKSTVHSRLNNWNGLISLVWMMTIFGIIHLFINPHIVNIGLLWLPLLFILVSAQLIVGYIFAHSGLKSKNVLGRSSAILAIIVFVWFVWDGLLPLLLYPFR